MRLLIFSVLSSFLLSVSIVAQKAPDVRLGFDKGEDKIVTFTPVSGERVVVIGQKKIEVWNYSTGKLLNSVDHRIDRFAKRGFFSRYVLLGLPEVLDWRPFRVDPKGRYLITAETPDGGSFRRAVVRDLSDLKIVAELSLPDVSVDMIGFDEQEGLIQLYGIEGPSGAIGRWDFETLKQKDIFKADEYKWHQMMSGGKRILLGSGDTKFKGIYGVVKQGNKLTLLDYPGGGNEKTLIAPGADEREPFLYTQVSSDEKRIISIRDKKLFVWDVEGDGKPKFVVEGVEPDLFSPTVHQLSADAILVRTEVNVARYRYEGDGRPDLVVEAGDAKDTLRIFNVSQESGYFVVADDDTLRMYSFDGDKPVIELKTKSDKERLKAAKIVSGEGKVAVARSNRGEGLGDWTEVYAISTGELLAKLPFGFSQNITDSNVTGITVDESIGYYFVWDFRTGFMYGTSLKTSDDKSLWESIGSSAAEPVYNVEHVTISPDGKYLLKYGDDLTTMIEMVPNGTVTELYDPDQAKMKKSGQIKKSGLSEAGWTPEGNYIFAIDSKSRKLNFWRVR